MMYTKPHTRDLASDAHSSNECFRAELSSDERCSHGWWWHGVHHHGT